MQQTVAELLAQEYRVITWDRKNSDGASDVFMGGDTSEAEMWADDLAEMVKQLGLAPCYLGGYAGCRTSPWVCLRHPEVVKGMILGFASGWPIPAARLAQGFYRQYIEAAEKGGMDAVASGVSKPGPGWAFAESIKLNPSNRDRLLAMDAQGFIRVMSRWERAFTESGDLPIAGCEATEEQWASIRVPTIIVSGANDPIHPTPTAQTLHRLIPNSEYHDPVMTLQEWEAVFGSNHYAVTSKLQGERLAPIWLDFLRRHEA